MTIASNSEAKHGRRWFQFNLRAGLLAVALIGIPLGGVAYERRTNAVGTAALAELE